MLTHKQLRAKALAIPAVKKEFETTRAEYAVLDEFLKIRAAKGLTQNQIAEKIGTTQSVVARLESGKSKHSPSIATLSRYAKALDCDLEIRLVQKLKPKARKTHNARTA